MGVCMEKDNLMLVMEYCQNGDVHTLLNGQTPLTFFQRMQIARDVALAMNWLHCMVRAAHDRGPPSRPLLRTPFFILYPPTRTRRSCIWT